MGWGSTPEQMMTGTVPSWLSLFPGETNSRDFRFKETELRKGMVQESLHCSTSHRLALTPSPFSLWHFPSSTLLLEAPSPPGLSSAPCQKPDRWQNCTIYDHSVWIFPGILRKLKALIYPANTYLVLCGRHQNDTVHVKTGKVLDLRVFTT